MQLTVRDAMSTDVVAAARQTSIADAERMLLSYGVDELFIVDERGLLCGVVPDYELLKMRLTPCGEHTTVESVMSRRFLVIGPESSLTVAGRYLREHIHRRLAVVEDGRLIGRITRRSVLACLQSLSPGAPERDGHSELDEATRHRVDETHMAFSVRQESARAAAPAL